jgi:hypothetical protein
MIIFNKFKKENLIVYLYLRDILNMIKVKLSNKTNGTLIKIYYEKAAVKKKKPKHRFSAVNLF